MAASQALLSEMTVQVNANEKSVEIRHSRLGHNRRGETQ